MSIHRTMCGLLHLQGQEIKILDPKKLPKKQICTVEKCKEMRSDNLSPPNSIFLKERANKDQYKIEENNRKPLRIRKL